MSNCMPAFSITSTTTTAITTATSATNTSGNTEIDAERRVSSSRVPPPALMSPVGGVDVPLSQDPPAAPSPSIMRGTALRSAVFYVSCPCAALLRMP
jgi:hypothetical protein